MWQGRSEYFLLIIEIFSWKASKFLTHVFDLIIQTSKIKELKYLES